MKYNLHLFLIICILTFNIIYSNYYLNLELIDIGDYLYEVNYENNPLFIINRDTYIFNNPLLSENIRYQIGKQLRFIIIGFSSEAYFNIIIHINEFMIKVNTNYWSCPDCTFNYDSINNRINIDTLNNKETQRYYFYFKINSISELENNIIENHKYYSFTKQRDFYIQICNLEEEIELINFNTTDIFYITEDQTLSTPYKDKGFKIIFENSISGYFFGLDASKNNKAVNNEEIFGVSESKGLRYRLSKEEKAKLGTYLK